jgi:hypothetical protein
MIRRGTSVTTDTLMRLCETLHVSPQWVLTGTGVPGIDDAVTGAVTSAAKNAQMVPVIAWDSVLRFTTEGKDVVILREDVTTAIEPAEGRFRVEQPDSSMEEDFSKGSLLDCSHAIAVEPEDIALVWLVVPRKLVARRVLPISYDADGNIATADLIASNESWRPMSFDSSNGDKIIAVVIEAIKPFRRPRRRQ